MSIYRKLCTVMTVALTIALLFIVGCSTAKTIDVGEVMQQPKGTKFYLAHNIWTNGRHRISSVNYQRGAVLPFGTEIKILNIGTTTIEFQVAPAGPKYTIKYEYAMEPIQGYLKKLITIKNRDELIKDTNPEFLDLMLIGQVVPGMTRKEVILTYGPPSPHRTPSQINPTWVYWSRKWPISLSFRVVFKGDKVLQVMR